MITKDEIESFTKMGFELENSFHRGIYGWQIFSHSNFKISIGYDKCFYEASIHSKSIKNLPLLIFLEEYIDDYDWLDNELKLVHKVNRMSPRNIITILKKELPRIIDFFSEG